MAFSCTHHVLFDLLHAAGWQRGGGVQPQRGHSILVQGDVESAVDVEAGGEHLGAVAPYAARPLLVPRGDSGTSTTPHNVPMETVLVVTKVGLGIVAWTESEDADLAASAGAEGVGGQGGQEGVHRQRRRGDLQDTGRTAHTVQSEQKRKRHDRDRGSNLKDKEKQPKGIHWNVPLLMTPYHQLLQGVKLLFCLLWGFFGECSVGSLSAPSYTALLQAKGGHRWGSHRFCLEVSPCCLQRNTRSKQGHCCCAHMSVYGEQTV